MKIMYGVTIPIFLGFGDCTSLTLRTKWVKPTV